MLYFCYLLGPIQVVPFSSLQSFSSSRSHLCFTGTASISQRHQSHQFGTLSPNSWSRYHRPPFVLLSFFSLSWGFPTNPTNWLAFLCHLLSEHFVLQFPFAFYFWPDLEWNLDSPCLAGKSRFCLCNFSPAHTFSFFPQVGSFCFPSLFSLEPTFLECGIDSFYSMLLLWSSSFSSRCRSYQPWLSPIS